MILKNIVFHYLFDRVVFMLLITIVVIAPYAASAQKNNEFGTMSCDHVRSGKAACKSFLTGENIHFYYYGERTLIYGYPNAKNPQTRADLELGVREYTSALSSSWINPGDRSRALLGRAEMHRSLGRRKAAINDYRQVIRINAYQNAVNGAKRYLREMGVSP
ncbi:MAG: hypothetical protein HN731_14335 [Rhodospirillaceae bacterium]|jgi:hypothetical protein|nr:hypothetical protein [Rhodospirillaceae bacterium]